MYVNTGKDGINREFLKGATRRLREEWMEGNLNYLRLMQGCVYRTEQIGRNVQDGGE